jgi:RNA polymerase sigma factor (sigma-70 family)
MLHRVFGKSWINFEFPPSIEGRSQNLADSRIGAMAAGQLTAVLHYLHSVARNDAAKWHSDGQLLQQFIQQRDGAAFDALIHRHGPMVFGVCRRVLRQTEDAEDAFQATFLVLVCKAGSLRSPSTVANWLYGVANRTALELKRARARRRAKEALVMPRTQSSPEVPSGFGSALDEALGQLPNKYREAVVLCDLEAKSRREAAVELGCAEGTVASRLARGRALLAKRLVERGIGDSTRGIAPLLALEAAPAHVPVALASVTAKAAGLLVAGQPLSTVVSANTAAAMRGALKSMLLVKLRVLTAVAAVLITGIATADLLHNPGPREDATASLPIESGNEEPGDEKIVVSGTVVDERGAPVAGALIQAKAAMYRTIEVKSDSTGKFELRVPDWPLFGALLAQFSDGRQGICKLRTDGPKTGIRIKLQAAREVKVSVVDARGAPVPNCRIELILDNMSTFFPGMTGGDGKAVLRYPAEARPVQVIAYKGGVGFDYVSTLITKHDEERKPLPDAVSLKLNGARTVRVQALDKAKRPLPGINIYAWYVQKPGMLEDANLSGCESLFAKTDARGVAVFDWLPVQFENAISFLCDSPDYSYTHQVSIKPDAAVADLTTTLLHKGTISGKATWPDGRPASGILIEASGAGSAVHNGHGRARTRADGAYEMAVNSEEAYIVTVVDERWAAPSHVGVVVRENQPVSDIDFKLSEGTIVRGTVTVGPKKLLSPDQYLSVRMSGGQIPNEIRAPGDEDGHEISFYRTCMTDAAGRYRCCLGPGEYQLELIGLSREPKNISVGQQREIVHDIHMPRPVWGMLSGKVIDQNGQPVAGATISGAYMQQTFVDIECTSAADGSFKVKRLQVATALYARSAERKLAGIMRIGADDDVVILQIAPTATARGRLVDANGKIIANGRVTCGIQIPLDEAPGSAFRSCFGSSARSGPDGRYTLEYLIPGEKYEVQEPYDEKSPEISTLGEVKPLNAEPINMGDTPVKKR